MPHFNSHTEEKHNLFYNLVIEMTPFFIEAVADPSNNRLHHLPAENDECQDGIQSLIQTQTAFVGEVMYRREF